MRTRGPEQGGFSLLEVTIALVISAAVLALALDILALDASQTRKLVSRNQATGDQLQAHRRFMTAASQAQGPGNAQATGTLRIVQGRLLDLADGKDASLVTWQRGKARFSYSQDGVTWSPDAPDTARTMIRFSLEGSGRQLVWIAP